MNKTRLPFVFVLFYVLAACRSEGGDVSVSSLAPVAVAPNPTPSPVPAPTSASAPPQNSLLPFIDNTKIPASEPGYSESRVRVDFPNHAKPTQNTNNTGQFRTVCQFSHMNYDDAIVYPGKKGAAHLHAYFGNTGIDYASTKESIETTGNSTCAGGTANRSGYWIPALIDTKDGSPLRPVEMMVYYKSDATGSTNIKAFPAGLRMIAGDMRSSAPQDYTNWGCYGPTGDYEKFTSIPSNCPVGGTIEMVIMFPSCWDGLNLDSPDHKSHMSFTVWDKINKAVVCPASHPVALPQITEKISYKVTEAGSTARWRLSSDNYGTDKPGGFSIHADWFNGWDPKVQETWVKNCLQASRDCHGYLLGDGTALY